MGIVPSFKQAKRAACKASIMLEGLPGSGKTGLALRIAEALEGNDYNRIFLIDTESNSALLFEGLLSDGGSKFGQFMHAPLDSDLGFSPTNYLLLRRAAIEAGAGTVIMDSISHAWNYKGGVLDLVTVAKSTNSRYAKDSYAAWGDENVAREKNLLLELIRSVHCHNITTVRVKERFEYSVDAVTGKNTLVSLGEQQLQQADLKYEPDLVLHLLSPGENKGGVVVHPRAVVIKSRYAIFTKGEEYDITPALLEQLRVYLAEGVDPEELLEAQRLDYVQAVTSYLDANKGAVAIWKVLKDDAGYKDTKLVDMPLQALKALLIKITS